jgi:hypothetical protein
MSSNLKALYYFNNLPRKPVQLIGGKDIGIQANLESAKYVLELGIRKKYKRAQRVRVNRVTAMGKVVIIKRQCIQVQDVSNLRQGEFYGKLFQSDYSTFKAQVRRAERPASPRWKPSMR